ncbi:hypothetical protein, partial [Kitasatospora nipponensis]|uniref:hypothetical protein n=1 Tax=Kitasatospora nipponensis TaxID=258049 RepID=UPI0031D3F8D0
APAAETAATGPAEVAAEAPRVPRRPSWAEETPMDDLPTLTDSLLGSREEWSRWEQNDEEPPTDGKGRKRRG